MKKLIYILLFVCSYAFSQTTYYVKPEGNDSNTGLDSTDANAWKTWAKAFNEEVIDPGDTVYFMGGVYYKDISEGDDDWYNPERNTSSGWLFNGSYDITVSGTTGNWVHYFAYPGETPILDGSQVDTTLIDNNHYMYMIRNSAHYEYVHFKGLTIRNSFGFHADPGLPSGGETRSRGWSIVNIDSVLIENCTVHNIQGVGFYVGDYESITLKNCDAFACIDSFAASPGESGQGFSFNHTYATNDGGKAYLIGCRAWNTSDQGINPALSHEYIEIDSCWSFDNGSAIGAFGSGGKLGWPSTAVSFDYTDPDPALVIKHSIFAFNDQAGLVTNEGTGHLNKSMSIYNNMVYHNGYSGRFGGAYGYGIWIFASSMSQALQEKRIFRNNISFDNEGANLITSSGAYYTHSNNTWDGLTASAADFSKTLDPDAILAELKADRQADGSLPELTFFKLAEGSDLIDAGYDVGLPYNGLAPDLGIFESYPPLDPPAPGTGYIGTNGLGKIFTDGNGKKIIFK